MKNHILEYKHNEDTFLFNYRYIESNEREFLNRINVFVYKILQKHSYKFKDLINKKTDKLYAFEICSILINYLYNDTLSTYSHINNECIRFKRLLKKYIKKFNFNKYKENVLKMVISNEIFIVLKNVERSYIIKKIIYNDQCKCFPLYKLNI